MNYKYAKTKYRNSTVIVSGANGFVGKTLIPKLVPLFKKIIGFDKTSSRTYTGSSNIRLFRLDLTKTKDLNKLKHIDGDVILVHLAAFVPHTYKSMDALLDVVLKNNVSVTQEILNVLKNRLNKVCYVSTLEVYGIPVKLPINENHPTNPISLYGLSKLTSEHFVRMFCYKNSIPFSILRCSSIYGPGENYERAIPNFIKAALTDRPILIYGDGLERRDYIYIDDACNAILTSVKNASSEGIVNVANGKSYSIKHLARLISRIARSKSKLTFLNRSKLAYDISFDIARAVQKLHFKPKTLLEEGLSKEIEWFRSNIT